MILYEQFLCFPHFVGRLQWDVLSEVTDCTEGIGLYSRSVALLEMPLFLGIRDCPIVLCFS